MQYHTIDSMNWRPKDDAVIPRWTLTPRRLRPIRVANKTQTRDPLNFGPCKADWPAAFVIK